MDIRKLTGSWYLRRKIFGGFNIMVQVNIQRWSDPSYGNGGGGYAQEVTEYQKAKESDLIELNIKCV